MSTRRTRSLPSARKWPKDANGKPLCGWCGGAVTPPRRTWCSEACVREHKIRSQPRFAAQLVFDRDVGICRICGVDCVVRRQEARKELKAATLAQPNRSPLDIFREVSQGWKAQGWPTNIARVWFEIDHIIPVCRSGGECGLDGLRLVCCPCHKRLTAQLAAERAAERKRHAKLTTDAPALPPEAPGAG